MNILYVSDEKYVKLLKTSLLSLFEAHINIDELNIFVVSDGISRRSRKELIVLSDRYDRKLVFLEKPDMRGMLGEVPKLYRWSDNIFCRLYIPACFRLNNIDSPMKVLYLDCDTIIQRELTELWDTNIGKNVCAAVLECMGDMHKKLIGLKKDDPYYNSGVILIDLNRWKKENIEKKCTEYLKKYNNYLEYPDESVFNGTLQGKIFTLPPEYNLTSLKCTYTFDELKKYRKSRVMYQKKDYDRALSNPVIIHYTSNFLIRRPWFNGKENAHRYEEAFRYYYRKVEDEYPAEKIGLLKKMSRMAVRRNRSFGIELFGYLHSYLKPLAIGMSGLAKRKGRLFK